MDGRTYSVGRRLVNKFERIYVQFWVLECSLEVVWMRAVLMHEAKQRSQLTKLLNYTNRERSKAESETET